MIASSRFFLLMASWCASVAGIDAAGAAGRAAGIYAERDYIGCRSYSRGCCDRRYGPGTTGPATVKRTGGNTKPEPATATVECKDGSGTAGLYTWLGKDRTATRSGNDPTGYAIGLHNSGAAGSFGRATQQYMAWDTVTAGCGCLRVYGRAGKPGRAEKLGQYWSAAFGGNDPGSSGQPDCSGYSTRRYRLRVRLDRDVYTGAKSGPAIQFTDQNRTGTAGPAIKLGKDWCSAQCGCGYGPGCKPAGSHSTGISRGCSELVEVWCPANLAARRGCLGIYGRARAALPSFTADIPAVHRTGSCYACTAEHQPRIRLSGSAVPSRV